MRSKRGQERRRTKRKLVASFCTLGATLFICYAVFQWTMVYITDSGKTHEQECREEGGVYAPTSHREEQGKIVMTFKCIKKM